MQYLTNPFFGIFLSLAVFLIGQWLFKKSKGFFLFQPLLVGMVLGIVFLVIIAQLCNTTTAQLYTEAFKPGGDMVFWFVTPATIAFAVPLYKQNRVIKKTWFIIMASLLISTVVSLIAIMLISKAIGLDKVGMASMLSQSATTAIALPLTEAVGGNKAITAMACILNAVIIYALGKYLVKWFRLDKDAVGEGLGLGTAGHTIGSAFALELGSVQGAMAAIAVVVIGLVDNLLVPIFARLVGL